jgi:hypothetical protein
VSFIGRNLDIRFLECGVIKYNTLKVAFGQFISVQKQFLQILMTTAGLEPATFWYHLAIEAKRATIALGSHIRNCSCWV